MELSDLAKLINLDEIEQQLKGPVDSKKVADNLKDQWDNGTLAADLVGAALDGIKPVLTAAVLKAIKAGEK